MNLHEKVFILVGVGPLRSAKSAQWMRVNIPGVYIPDAILERISKVPLAEQAEEGIRICIELIHQIREIEGISGVHVMAYRQEERVTELILKSGLLPR